MGTFLIFFFLGLLGAAWWYAASHQKFAMALREIGELRKQAQSGNSPETVLDLNRRIASFNRALTETVTGRIMAKTAGFRKEEPA